MRFREARSFALGVSPYINASIITQLLCVALPSWEALQKETTGKDKLDEYTKRIALAMAVVMSVGYYFVLRNYGALKYTAGKSGIFAAIVIIATFLAGSQISVWLGGRIDEYGIGNGVSLLIFCRYRITVERYQFYRHECRRQGQGGRMVLFSHWDSDSSRNARGSVVRNLQ